MNKYFVLFLLFPIFFSCKQQSKSSYQFPFQNPTLKMDQRVEDLVSRLTLDQKIAQLMNQAPGIDSLGIPAGRVRNIRIRKI